MDYSFSGLFYPNYFIRKSSDIEKFKFYNYMKKNEKTKIRNSLTVFD